MRTLAAAWVLPLFVAGTANAAWPEVALLVGAPQGDATALVFAKPDDTSAHPAAAVVSHPPGAAVQGVLVPHSREAFVIADEDPRGDGSFGAYLLRVGAGHEPFRLATSVVHASHPLLTADGRLFVERGREGPPLSDAEMKQGRLREDTLTVDEVGPKGELRTVLVYSGYATHLCGAVGNELIVYRVKFGGADLVAVDLSSGRVRPLLALPPFARDFVVDPKGALLFTETQPGADVWEIWSLDLRTREVKVLGRGGDPGLSPMPWPNARLAFSPGGAAGLHVEGTSAPTVAAPMGEGSDKPVAFLGDRFALLSHERPSELPVPFVMDVRERTARRLPVADGMRAVPIGFVETAR